MEKAAAARRSNNESSILNNCLYVRTPIKEGLYNKRLIERCEKNCSVIITAAAEQHPSSSVKEEEEDNGDNERKHEAEATLMEQSVVGNDNTIWKLSISGSGDVKRAYNILQKNVSYIERVIAKTNGGGGGGISSSTNASSSTVKQEAATTTTTTSPTITSSSSSNNHGANKYNDNNNITSLSYYASWIPSEDLSEDENIMDLVLIVTRSSQLKQGSMACIIVSPSLPTIPPIPIKTETTTTTTTSNTSTKQRSIFDRIVCVATNRSFYKENDSDVHAEIVALGQVAGGRGGDNGGGDNDRTTSTSTKGATAYITMPPCKRCFAALVMAGICRIVSRKPPCMVVQQAAIQHNIDISIVEDTPQQRDRIQTIINIHNTNNNNSNNKKRKKGQNGEEGEERRKVKTEM